MSTSRELPPLPEQTRAEFAVWWRDVAPSLDQSPAGLAFGAFLFSKAAAEAATARKCVEVCEAQLDAREAKQSEERARQALDGQDTQEQLHRLRHASNVGLYNAGPRKCAAAIRSAFPAAFNQEQSK
jgi:hypothetical protein